MLSPFWGAKFRKILLELWKNPVPGGKITFFQLCGTSTNYKKTIPPRDASVNVSIAILKMVSIEEITHSTNIQFQVSLEWQDDRMLFHNLKERSSLNKIEDSAIGELWLPVVIYQKESSRLGMPVPVHSVLFILNELLEKLQERGHF